MAIDDLSAATDPGETLRVDSRGRINIGRYAAAGTNFIVRQTPDGDIVLSPAVVMTVREFEALGRRGAPDPAVSPDMADGTPAE